MSDASPFAEWGPNGKEKKRQRRLTSDGRRGRGGRGHASFTVSEAAEIRRRLQRFENPRTLATEYGVDRYTILRAGKRDYVGRPDEDVAS